MNSADTLSAHSQATATAPRRGGAIDIGKLSERDRSRAGGMHIGPVQCLDHLVEAWELVYKAYLRSGLIDPNPHRIHTSLVAARSDSCVISGRIGGLTVCTLTLVPDGAYGLPLDRPYADELGALRASGRRVCEIGLFADRREHVTRSLPAIIEMMRFGFFAAYHQFDDVVAGVHPHHAGFYRRYFAFEPVGEPTVHPGVKNNPVILLRLPLQEAYSRSPLPKGLAMYRENPISHATIEQRYHLTDADVAASRIGPYLEDCV